MVKVGIIGHTGRLGKPLVEILNTHPHVKIGYTESRKEGICGNLSDVELVFLALPKGKSEAYLPKLKGKKIIDLSIDNRLDEKWIYGLPELNKDKIKTAEKVANPGCYATAILEALLPIKDIICNVEIKAYSGVSGRPNQPVIKNGRIEKYSEGKAHPQVAEIEKYLGKGVESLETYLVYPLETGILAKIEAQLNSNHNISSQYKEFFRDNIFLKLADFDFPENINVRYLKEKINIVKNTNFCSVSYKIKDNAIIITSILDNLIKGGSGQAVQNFNLMNGFDETTGLL